MPLPIALGGKCESAQHLPGPCCHPDDLEDGTSLEPLELYQTLAWGICPKKEWLVRVVASYYDLIIPTTGHREYTMVEVRVQVSYLTRPISPNYRETSHHLKLFDGAKDDYPQSQPQVVVSDDRRNLAVLLFHPHQQSSAVVIFQLRIPRSDLSIPSPIPLPSYCATTGNDNNASSVFSREAPMVASHPRFVSVWGISTICTIPNVSPPIILAVCHDGGLVWLDVRSSLAVASGMLPSNKSEYLPFSSIVAAPGSTMEKGTLLAISAKRKSTILISWCLEKNKSRVEQTFLKRASTGAVVVVQPPKDVIVASPTISPNRRKMFQKQSHTFSDYQQSPVDSNNNNNNANNNNRTKSHPPITPKFRPRTAPLRSFSAGATPNVQRALKAVFSPERMKALSPMFSPRRPLQIKQDDDSTTTTAITTTTAGSNSTGIGELPDLTAHLFAAMVTNRNNNNNSNTTTASNNNTNTNGGSKKTSSPLKDSKNKETLKRKEHMNVFVMKELQRKTEPGSFILKSTKTTNIINTPRQQRRRRSETAIRKSGESSLMRSMQLEILSSLEEDDDDDNDSDNVVIDATFGSMSSILCAVYKGTKNNSKVARIFNLCEMGTFQPIATLTLSSEQVMDTATDVTRKDKTKSTYKHSNGTTTPNNTTPDKNGNNHVATSTSTSALEEVMATSITCQFGSEYDPNSDCFAISTTINNDGQWIGCLWNWRNNALGFLIKNSTPINYMLWSRMYFSTHPQQGSHFTYLESTQEKKYLQTRKEVTAIGLLSPPDSYCTAIEPCSLLLSSDCISFPDATQRETGVSELEWKSSKLPFTYLNSYGPPKIASVGRLKGDALAVASSCGVCILDSKYRWKQFGSPAEERTFSIVAMTWWEGTNNNNNNPYTTTTKTASLSSSNGKNSGGGSGNNSNNKEEDGDLLVAIIQSNNGRQYLSCWSPSRLDLAHQLLETKEQIARRKEEPSDEPSWGIPLTKSIKATNISLLAEPEPHDETTSTNNDDNSTTKRREPRRAVVFLSSADMETCAFDYSIFQLQVVKARPQDTAKAESYVEQKPYSVLVNPSAQGTVQVGTRSVGPVSSLFLSGASFRFDLETSTEVDDDFVALVGLVRAPGGIEAIALNASGKSWFNILINAHEVSRVLLADIIRAPQQHTLNKNEQGPTSNCFVWLIELVSGEIFTWSAPFLVQNGTSSSVDDDEFQCASFLRETKIPRPKGLRPPTLVCKRESRNGFLLGTLCHIGTSSDWMQQTSSGCQSDISLGVVPRSIFGCVLRAGQTSRNLHRHVTDDFDTDIFGADFLEPEVHGPTSFIMTPPVFVSSLYALFLEAAYLRTEIPVMEESNVISESELCKAEQDRLKAIEQHVDYRLRASPNEDAVMMALRLLIIRSVEMVSSVSKKHGKEQSDVTHSSLLLASALFSEIVDAVRRCTTNLQFASLFLEAGRQIEPSCLVHLFPLPIPGRSLGTTSSSLSSSKHIGSNNTNNNRFHARSVLELFSLCIEEGSLAAAASALPLFGSRIQARNYCDLLLSKSMEAFLDNTHSSRSNFDTTQEERRVIGDIFRYGMKLEDSGRLEHKMLLEQSMKNLQQLENDDDHSNDNLYASLDDPDDFGAASDTSSVSSVEEPLIITTTTKTKATKIKTTPTTKKQSRTQSMLCIGGRQSSILNYLVPSIFDDPQKEEEAIRKAATSFIDSELEPTDLDFLVQPLNTYHGGGSIDSIDDDNAHPHSIGELQVQTVGGLVADTIVNTLLAPKRTDCHWKAIALLARLLLQNGLNSSSSSSSSSPNQLFESFVKVCQMVQSDELNSLIPDQKLKDNDNNGSNNTDNDESNNSDGDDSTITRVINFIILEVKQCQSSIQEHEARGIVDFVLQLLVRLEDFPLPEENHLLFATTGLLYVAIIAGHVCGRTPMLLSDLHDDNILVRCYIRALESGKI